MTEEERAGQEARRSFLVQQSTQLLMQIRNVRMMVLLAAAAGELSDQVKDMIYAEALNMAASVDRKGGQS